MIQTWRILTGKDMVKVETWFDMEVDRQRVGATTNRNASQHHSIRPRTSMMNGADSSAIKKSKKTILCQHICEAGN